MDPQGHKKYVNNSNQFRSNWRSARVCVISQSKEVLK